MEAINLVNSSYIKELISKGVREDARGLLDIRPIKITRGVMSNAEGSAQVDLGNTRVLAAIKMAVEKPMPDTTDMGNLMVQAELLPLADPSFESGPPSPEAIEFARVVDRGIRAAECVKLESMFIETDKVWTIFVDLYVLNNDGNLFDAGALAAMGAMMDTKVPKYENGEVVRTERVIPLPVCNLVTSTTFAKIGGKYVIDPNRNEESAADARITITNDGKQIRAMQKGLSGSFSKQDIDRLIEVSFNKHNELRSILEGR